jgi:tetratricopeptide (TPR) repeat protein
MSRPSWPEVRTLLERALEQPAVERAEFVRREAGGDDALAREVARLLELEDAASERLATAGLKSSLSAAFDGPIVGERIGRYTLVRVIGRGGMGTVFEALQDEPRRRVAVKVMHWSLRPNDQGRFRYESEVLGRLDHPHIARILEAGTRSGGSEDPYFALEYVADARTIVEFAAHELLSLPARIELLLDACDAVQHGHQKGVIHRDLKPSNLLVDRAGHVKLIDFGIARPSSTSSEERSVLTQAGQLVGTPAYMAPEQFNGRPEDIDARTDVYSLGVVAYELVCNAPPYRVDSQSLVELERVVREAPPRRLREHDPALPDDLEWVLFRALEKDPGRRYASVSELAADLRRFLAREVVLARPASALYRASQFARRHRGAVAAAALVALALAAGTIGTALGLVRALGAEALARTRYERAEHEASVANATTALVDDLLRSVAPEHHGADARLLHVLSDGAEKSLLHLAHLPEVDARFSALLGRTYRRLREYEAAEPLLRRAVQRYEQTGGARAGELAGLHGDIADCLRHSEGLDVAKPLMTAAIARAEHELGPRSATALELRELWLRSFQDTSDHEAYITALEHTSDDCVAALGATHTTTLSVRSMLAIELERGGEWARARGLLDELIECSSTALGEKAATTLQLRIDHARLLMNRGEYGAAEASLERIRAECVARFGRDTRLAASAALQLGRTKKLRYEHDAALQILGEALASYDASRPGRRDEFAAALMVEYADALSKAGDLASAERHFDDAIVIYEAELGAASAYAVEARIQRAATYIQIDDHARAKDELQRLVALADGFRGANAVVPINLYQLLAPLVIDERPDEARAMTERALELARRELPPTAMEVSAAVYTHGLVLMHLDDIEGSVPLLEEALAGLVRSLGPRDERTAEAVASLAVAYRSLGRVEALEDLRARFPE